MSIDNSQRLIEMKKRLKKALEPTHLDIIDDSHKHAGHAGAKEGKGHFSLIIQSNFLDNKKKLEQHRIIYQALGSMMQEDIHALSIKILE